jgi:hypothetical protein
MQTVIVNKKGNLYYSDQADRSSTSPKPYHPAELPEPQPTQGTPIASLAPRLIDHHRSPKHQRFLRTQQRSKPPAKSRKSMSHSHLEPVVLAGIRLGDDFTGTKGDRWVVDRLDVRDSFLVSRDRKFSWKFLKQRFAVDVPK